MMSETKPHVAIIIPGGIGTGKKNLGIPVLESIVKLIGADFSITVFQLFRVNEDYRVNGFEMIDIHSCVLPIRLLKFFFVFRRVARTKTFQAIHGFWAFPSGFLAVLAGKIFNVKSIVSILGGDVISLPGIKYGQLRNPIQRQLVLWTLKHAGQANALTRYLVNNLEKVNFSRPDLTVIPWGVDTSLFEFREKEINGTVKFLHVANLHPVKDQQTLLKAFAMIRKQIRAHLTIIGEGSDFERVQRLIAQLNLREEVLLLGPVDYKQLPAYYHQSDILLHTSVSEGQSEVVTEAMSCGVLVCGTKVGLIHDLQEYCVAIDVGDFNSLATKTLELLSDPDRTREMRRRARQWTVEHSIGWTCKKLSDLYENGL